MSAPVSTRVESGVLVVTIERPEARNAINTVTAEAIGAAMDRLDAETALVAGVDHRRRRDVLRRDGPQGVPRG